VTIAKPGNPHCKLSDVPLKLLRKFCVDSKFGIKSLSTSTKDGLLSILEPMTDIVSKFEVWLAEYNKTNWCETTVESLPRGRRITTVDKATGWRRVHGLQAARLGWWSTQSR